MNRRDESRSGGRMRGHRMGQESGGHSVGPGGGSFGILRIVKDPSPVSVKFELAAGNRILRVVAIVNQSCCTGCGICVDECSSSAIFLGEVAVIDFEACTGCGACIDVCPSDALVMVQRGTPARGTER